MELVGVVQNYHWGKKGNNSIVAQLAAISTVDEDQFYAELWMGTHANGPASILNTGELLSDWLGKNDQVIGEGVVKAFGSAQQLPFLFKILSVKQPLSIQAHPTKTLAEKLHLERPDLYKDPNHKPELAIALSEFEALCGFRPIEEIKQFLKDVPELRSVVGEETATEFLNSCAEKSQNRLKICFQAMLTTTDDIVEKSLDQLLSRMKNMDEDGRKDICAELIEKCHFYYPGDVGCFGPYFFNYLVLKPGEAVFLPANEAHAYISGDCVECMACSDNTIRAGLTPKLKDIDTLCSMLSYICEPGSSKIFGGVIEDEFATLFKPPIPDFAVVKFEIPGGKKCCLAPRNSASISILIEGVGELDGSSVRKGSVVFIGALQSKTVAAKQDILMFQAFANV